MPVVNDPKEYGDHWNAWWWSMQPTWRDPELPSNLPSEVPAGSWSNMLCGGWAFVGGYRIGMVDEVQD